MHWLPSAHNFAYRNFHAGRVHKIGYAHEFCHCKAQTTRLTGNNFRTKSLLWLLQRNISGEPTACRIVFWQSQNFTFVIGWPDPAYVREKELILCTKKRLEIHNTADFTATLQSSCNLGLIHTGRARATQENGTYWCEWGCPHCTQATSKDLRSNLRARVLCGLGPTLPDAAAFTPYLHTNSSRNSASSANGSRQVNLLRGQDP